MGSAPFIQHLHCNPGDVPAEEAFAQAVKQARYDHGHAGYSGTLAEKDEFVIIAEDSQMSAEEYAEELIANGDDRIDDKWGPAGCLRTPTGYLFFGWASS